MSAEERASLILEALHTPESMATLDLKQWETLIRQARRGSLLARLWYLLQQHGLTEAVPARTRRHFEWADVAAERHTMAVVNEVAMIRKAVGDVPIVLLKGAAYVMAGLTPARGRVFSDVDILVPKERLAEVEAALVRAGWAGTHHDAYDQRYYREWMHELPPMQHALRGTEIDVHHAILPQTMAVHPDSRKLRAAAIGVAGQTNLQVLAPADMVLHGAAHLFYEGEFQNGMRDLSDLAMLLQDFSAAPGFWDQLAIRARELELTRVLFYALRYASRLLKVPVPAVARQATDVGRPNAVLLALMDGLLLRALLPDHSSCADGLTLPARKCLYIRANWLRMPPLLLARHLFHKAFISPATTDQAGQPGQADQADRHA